MPGRPPTPRRSGRRDASTSDRYQEDQKSRPVTAQGAPPVVPVRPRRCAREGYCDRPGHPDPIGKAYRGAPRVPRRRSSSQRVLSASSSTGAFSFPARHAATSPEGDEPVTTRMRKGLTGHCLQRGAGVLGMATRPDRHHASRRSSSVQAMASTMATKRNADLGDRDACAGLHRFAAERPDRSVPLCEASTLTVGELATTASARCGR